MVVPRFPPPVVGGLERQAFELSMQLPKFGHKVTVLSYRFAKSHEQDPLVSGVTVIRIQESKLPLVGLLLTAWSLARQVVGLRLTFEIVHVHTLSWFSAIAVMLAKIMRKKCVVKLANTGERGIPGARGTFLGRLRIRILLCADCFVAMNEASVGELRTIGVAETRVLFRPNGIRIQPGKEEFAVDESRSMARVVFLSRLVKQKRCYDLLEAWKSLTADGVNAELLIAGTGPEGVALQVSAQRLGLRNVHFVGHIDDVESFLGSADILVLPSAHEGNSNSVLEGMRASLPIVATDIPGTRLQVGSEGKTLLYSVGDTKRLAELISNLVRNRDLRRAIGVAMRLRVLKKFDMSKVTADYAAAYEVLIKCREADMSKIGSVRRWGMSDA